MKYPIVLTIAGSDSSGGAGIQADIKAISATGSYAASAITAVTIQNTLGVQNVFPIPPEIVAGQIEAVLSDIGTDAIKIGMLHSTEVIMAIKHAIVSSLSNQPANIVLDPVMVSTSGHRLIEESAIGTLQTELMPIARVITPNIPEAEILTGTKITSKNDMAETAKRLSINGQISVLMKAGHACGDDASDFFYNAEADTIIELPAKRCNTKNTHGTGCTISSAFASYLAQGYSLNDAARLSKIYISKAIAAGADYEIGNGHGPVCHFFNLNETFRAGLS